MHALKQTLKRLKKSKAKRALALSLVLAAAIGGQALVPARAFRSAEVAFTDSSGDLSIVPASCPSNPDYAGQCSGGSAMQDSSSASAQCSGGAGYATLSWTYASAEKAYVTFTDPNGVKLVYQDFYSVGAKDIPGLGAGTYSWSVTPDDGSGNSGTVQVPACLNDAATASGQCADGTGHALLTWAYPSASAAFVAFTDPRGVKLVYQNFSGSGSKDIPGLGAGTYSWSVTPNAGPANSGSVDVPGNCDGATVTSCPSGYTLQNGMCVPQCGMNQVLQSGSCVCAPGYVMRNGSCVLIQQCSPVGDLCGSDGNLYSQAADCSLALQKRCQYGCGDHECLPPPPPNIVLWKVSPTLVHSDGTTNVSWQAEDVSSCAVNGTFNGTQADAWTGDSGAKQSSAIFQQTIYTLTCQPIEGADGGAISTSTTVNVVPTFHEK